MFVFWATFAQFDQNNDTFSRNAQPPGQLAELDNQLGEVQFSGIHYDSLNAVRTCVAAACLTEWNVMTRFTAVRRRNASIIGKSSTRQVGYFFTYLAHNNIKKLKIKNYTRFYLSVHRYHVTVKALTTSYRH